MPAVKERTKMTRSTYQALKRHILREREKRKQEQEADLALERQRKEAERRKKLENENKNSLQQTKDELVRLDKLLEEHKKHKSKLFAQLKRILESENTKKEIEKKHETQLHPSNPNAPHNPIHYMGGTGHMGRPVMYKPAMHTNIPQPSSSVQSTPAQKEPSSVSPTPMPSVFSFHHGNQPGNMFGGAKYPASGPETFSGFNPHSQKDSQMHKKHHEQSQLHTSTADTYNNQHTIAQMLQKKVQQNVLDEKGRPQHHQPTPVKGSIMTGYPIHTNNPAAVRGRPPQPPGPSPKMSGGKPLYPPPRESRPYYK